MRVVRLLGLVALSVGLMSAVQAHEVENIIITNAWARATAGAQESTMDDHSGHSMHSEATSEPSSMGGMDMGKVSAAYMSIRNDGDHSMTLVSASTPLAGKVEIHESKMEGDVMRMAELPEGLAIAEGETAELKPGGFHVMLMDLKADLVEGTAIPLELVFSMGEGMGTLSVMIGAAVLIEAPEASPLEITQGWVRPTAMKDEHQHGGMEATAEAGMHSHGGMEATAEAGMHSGMDMGGVSAAYMMITNTSDSPVRIVSASAETALVGMTQIHESVMEGDIMRMNELADGLLIDPGQTVELAPGGLHIMLMELVSPLVEGEALAITLTLDDGRSVVIGLPIYDKMAMDMGH